MQKLHLLLKKEDVDQALLDNKVVVVFDILLATSTISALLEFGAQQVIPAFNSEEARMIAGDFDINEVVLVGEYDGKTLQGFLSPSPMRLKDHVYGKTVILSTTNGSIALKKTASAHLVYAASILNTEHVAKELLAQTIEQTVLLVCSGSKGAFCLEDFYGAGMFVDTLLRRSLNRTWKVSDAAMAARYFYLGNKSEALSMFQTCRVGKMLDSYGFHDEVRYVLQPNLYSSVPRLNNGVLVNTRT